MNSKKFWLTVFLAWLVFIGIDFFFHAGLLENLWKEELEAIKPSLELAILIPIGYLSFFLLCLLTGYVYTGVFSNSPDKKKALKFGLIFAILFVLSNLTAVFAYISIPLKHLLLTNSVYFIELMAVVYVFYRADHAKTMKGLIWRSIAGFFILIILGVIIQNIF